VAVDFVTAGTTSQSGGNEVLCSGTAVIVQRNGA
jgi:hypothetical protein